MGFLEERDTNNAPSIPEYYKGKTVLITGGSGFMGQALVEKLLYSCPELDSIYLLMRQKKGVLPEERLEKLYSGHCFNRLRGEKPKIFLEKVHVVAGDVTELGLGLSDKDRTLLISRVNIIFHAAASVRFDDPLSYAVKLNVRGTRDIVNLAKEIRNLSAFVHVSTCYSNAKYSDVEETLYPPLADWREVMEVCETLNEETIKTLTPKYLNGMPNTYVFTKQLAEHVLGEEQGKLPIVIIRPSIVSASVAEPAPGWINNFNGPGALFVACGKGIKHCLYADSEIVCDYIPLDVCIKHFVVAAWARGTIELKRTDDLPIYNCAANDGLTMAELTSRSVNCAVEYPVEDSIWVIKQPIMTTNFLYFYFCTWFYQLIPAMLVDFALWISGRKPILKGLIITKNKPLSVLRYTAFNAVYLRTDSDPRLLKLQKKIYAADLALNYFMTRSWNFANTNFLKLRETIKKEDLNDFYYVVENFYTVEYLKNTFIGGKVFLLNEKMENLHRAKAQQKRFNILDKAVKTIFYACVLWWFINTKYLQNVYRLVVE